MKLLAACFVRQEEKRRFGIGARPRRIKAETEPVLSAGQDAPPGGVGKHARYVPVRVRRTIHTRDGGQCTFVSAEVGAAALARFSNSIIENRLQGMARPTRRTYACCADRIIHCMRETASARCMLP